MASLLVSPVEYPAAFLPHKRGDGEALAEMAAAAHVGARIDGTAGSLRVARRSHGPLKLPAATVETHLPEA